MVYIMDFADAQKMIQQNNAWSAEQAQKQMDFQERMSNTAFQRQVADMKAAGINPVLSSKIGGASTPSGAMGDTDTSGTSTLISMAMSALGTAGSAARAAANASSNKNDPNNFSVDGVVTPAELQNFRDMINRSGLPSGVKAVVGGAIGYIANWYNSKGVNPYSVVNDLSSAYVNSGRQGNDNTRRTVQNDPQANVEAYLAANSTNEGWYPKQPGQTWQEWIDLWPYKGNTFQKFLYQKGINDSNALNAEMSRRGQLTGQRSPMTYGDYNYVNKQNRRRR